MIQYLYVLLHQGKVLKIPFSEQMEAAGGQRGMIAKLIKINIPLAGTVILSMRFMESCLVSLWVFEAQGLL